MVNLEEKFSLKWNNFQTNLASGFQNLLEEEVMVDVTLAAGGHLIQAHKIVLSVCSSYFKNIFQINPCKHPIVILKDVGYKELTHMLDFMYKGEASVKQENLAGFLKLAETLNVKGLAVNDNDCDENNQNDEQVSDNLMTTEREKDRKMNKDTRDERKSRPLLKRRKRKSSETLKTCKKKERMQITTEQNGKMNSIEEHIDEFDDNCEDNESDDDFFKHSGGENTNESEVSKPQQGAATTVPIPHSYMVRFKYDHNPIWDFFIKDKENERALCELCQRQLIFKRGSTSSLINHLRRFHITEFHLYSQQRDYFHEQRRDKMKTVFSKGQSDPRTVLQVDLSPPTKNNTQPSTTTSAQQVENKYSSAPS